MISIVFIRHGATQGNLERKYIGRTDEPLCEEGISQARNLRDKNLPHDYIFVSPMLRARQTAEMIFPDRGYIVEDDLREMDFGVFEGKTAPELSGNDDYRIWVDSMCTLPIPEGEGMEKMKKRCGEAFRKLMNSVPDNSGVSFVVHGGTIMAVLAVFAEPKCGFFDYNIGNCEYLACTYENGKIKII